MKRRIVSAQKLREDMKYILDAVKDGKNFVFVMRRSQPTAVIVSPEWYERALEALDKIQMDIEAAETEDV